MKQLSKRLKGVETAIEQACGQPGEESVHDLRVSLRRFSQALQAFSGFLPARRCRRVRLRCRTLLHATAEVRNRDIALGLLQKAEIDTKGDLASALRQERSRAEAALMESLWRARRKQSVTRWRERLGLS